MSIDTPFIELQIKLIDRLFHEMQWGHTSHSFDVFYTDIKRDLKNPLDEEVLKVIDTVEKSGGINNYEIVGDIDGTYSVISSTMVFFDIDEEKLLDYKKLLEFQLGENTNKLFKFKYKITINFKEGILKHGNKTYELPINKSGIRLLSLMLTYYPSYVRFKQIDDEFELTKIREDEPRLADKRIYEIRDDLLVYLTKSVHLSEKIAKQFVENIRGKGYKVSLKLDV